LLNKSNKTYQFNAGKAYKYFKMEIFGVALAFKIYKHSSIKGNMTGLNVAGLCLNFSRIPEFCFFSN